VLAETSACSCSMQFLEAAAAALCDFKSSGCCLRFILQTWPGSDLSHLSDRRQPPPPLRYRRQLFHKRIHAISSVTRCFPSNRWWNPPLARKIAHAHEFATYINQTHLHDKLILSCHRRIPSAQRQPATLLVCLLRLSHCWSA
jgi:hypothetical protein